MPYLIDNPPRRSQFRSPRRAQVSGVIAVHTAENTPDHVAFDGGAEAVARFIQGRSDAGSYHDLCDSDSCINLVPYDAEAYHDGTGTNPHSYGLSVATRADVWPLAPKAWRDGAIEQAAQAAARYARWVKARTGIIIPATRITADRARLKVPGFVTHAQLDPGRRSDPGAGFPWDQFLTRYAALMGDTPNPPEEDDMAAPYSLWRIPMTMPVYRVAADGQSAVWVESEAILAFEQGLLALGGFDSTVHETIFPGSRDWLESILRAPGSRVAP